MCKRFKPPLLDTTPFIWPYPPHVFFPYTPLWQYSFVNIAPMKYGVNTKINSCGKIISWCLEDYKMTVHPVFISSIFICNARLRFDLKWWWSQYQNEPKEKQTLQIKDLMSKEHYCYKVYALLQLSVYIHGLPPPVLQANLKRPSIFDFLKIWTPCL